MNSASIANAHALWSHINRASGHSGAGPGCTAWMDLLKAAWMVQKHLKHHKHSAINITLPILYHNFPPYRFIRPPLASHWSTNLLISYFSDFVSTKDRTATFRSWSIIRCLNVPQMKSSLQSAWAWNESLLNDESLIPRSKSNTLRARIGINWPWRETLQVCVLANSQHPNPANPDNPTQVAR